MTSQEALQSLSDEELASLLMNKLWRFYDAGGISMGRSSCALLLEAVIWISPEWKMEVDFDFDKVSGWEALVEANHRFKKKRQKRWIQLSLFTKLEFIPYKYYLCFVLRSLERWYQVRAKIHPEHSYIYETDILKALSKLLLVKEHLKQFVKLKIKYAEDALIDEGRDRYSEIGRNTKYPH